MAIQTLSREEISAVSGGADYGPLGNLVGGVLTLVLDVVKSKPVQGLLQAVTTGLQDILKAINPKL